MESVVQVVTTPLALAALAILVLGVALQQAKAKPQVVRSVFWLILALSALGNVGYLLNAIFLSDTSIRGRVKDEDGIPISSAIVDLDDVGRTATADNGNFEKTVPYSRQQKIYTGSVQAEGYQNSSLRIDGPKPAFYNVVMKKKSLVLSDVIDLADGISVTQNIGDPAVVMGFSIKKPDRRSVVFSIMTVDVQNMKGDKASLLPTVVQKDMVIHNEFLKEIRVDESVEGSDFTILFEPFFMKKWATLNKISQQSDRMWYTRCGSTGYIDDDAERELKSYFDKAFFWKISSYELTITYKLNGITKEISGSFNINDKDEENLHLMREKLRNCGGFAVDINQIGQLSFSDKDAQNWIMKTANLEYR